MSYYIVIVIIYNLLKLIFYYPYPQVSKYSCIRNHVKHFFFSYNKGDSHCIQLLLWSSISTYFRQSEDNHLTKLLRPVPLSAKLVYFPYSLPILYQKLKQTATVVGQNFIKFLTYPSSDIGSNECIHQTERGRQSQKREKNVKINTLTEKCDGI